MSYYSSTTEVMLRPFLEERRILTSAPCRIDFGGSWDLKGVALLGQNLSPVSVNIALNLRTRVKMLPFKDGWVRVSTPELIEECPLSEVDLRSPLRLVYAILFHFAVSGVHLVIETEVPRRSGLGGSGALAVAVIAGVSKALAILDKTPELSRSQIVRLAHDIEDGLRISFTGMQDQAAAVYGGVNKWCWNYRSPSRSFSREELAKEVDGPELAKHLLLVYTGQEVGSDNITTEQELRGFLNGSTRQHWYELHYASVLFAQAIMERNWKEAGRQLQRGTTARIGITPDISTLASFQLVKVAEEYGCGAGFAGEPKGFVWAIGPKGAIDQLRHRWKQMLEFEKDGKLLQCNVDFTGIKTFLEPDPRAKQEL